MNIIQDIILKSVYGVSQLSEKEITQIEDHLNIFVHQVRLERGKEPSSEELCQVRSRLAKEFGERK